MYQTSAREAAISLQQDVLSQLKDGGWHAIVLKVPLWSPRDAEAGSTKACGSKYASELVTN